MKKFSVSAVGKIQRCLVHGLLLAVAGVICGALLGDIVAGSRLRSSFAVPAPYAKLSGNPDAAIAPSISENPCSSCPDSYGVAARLRADRTKHTANAFRALGSVDPDVGAFEAEDDYQYGGRFPDLPPRTNAPSAKRLDGLPGTDPGLGDRTAPSTDGPDPSAEAP